MKYKHLSAALSKLNLSGNDIPKKFVYLNLEAELALDEFLAMQQRVSHQDMAEQEVSEAEWDNLKALLANRWERIKDTNASYCANPDISISEAYIELAKLVSDHTAQDLNQPFVPWLQLLIPSLSKEVAQRYHTTNFYGLVMSDDNQRLISVPNAMSLSGLDDRLSRTEAERVRTYSHGSMYYCDLLQRNEKIGLLIKAKHAMTNTLSNRDAHANAYREAGKALLQANVLAHADRAIKSKEQLLALLTKKANDHSHWEPIVNSLSLPHLQALLIDQHQSLAESIASLELTQDETQNIALTYLYFSLYCKQRSAGYEAGDSLLGAAVKTIPAMFGYVPRMSEKIEAVGSLLNLILKQKSLSGCAEIIKSTFNEKQQAMLSDGLVKSLMDKFINMPVIPTPSPEAAVLHV